MSQRYVARLAQLVLRGRFRRGFVATMSFDALSRICGAGSAVILLRSLRVPDYAYVVVFLAVAQTFSGASTGGIRLGYLRREAERVSRGLETTSLFLPVLALGSLFLLVLCAGGWSVSQMFGIGPNLETRAAFWSCVFMYGLGQATTDLVINRHEAQLAFRRAGQVNLARSAVLLASSLVIAVTGAWSGLAASLLLAASLAGFSLIAAYIVLRLELVGGIGRFPLRDGLAGSPWLTVYSFASAAYSNADVLVVAALLTKFDTATFGVAQRYYSIVLGAVPALIAVFRVRTSQVDLVDSFAAQRKMVLDWMRRLAPVMTVAALAAATAAPFLLPLIDRGRYPQSIIVFQILLVYAVAVYLILPAPSILMTRRRYALLASLTVATLVVNVAGDILAASAWGVIGVAICASVVNVIGSVITTVAALRPPERRSASEIAAPA
jgi:O-antigen/teichoic acid export membrane protein